MAKLIDDKAIAEIDFVAYKYGYVSYNLRLLYGGKQLINPELLFDDAFYFDEHGRDSLIPFFEYLLEEDKNAAWESLEPEVRIEAVFYPELGLREIESNPRAIYVSEDYQEKLQLVDEAREKAGGKLPDDNFAFLFRVQESKLKPYHEDGPVGYGGFVPAMEVWASRKELEDFVEQLKADYEEWKIRNREQIEYYGGRSHILEEGDQK